MDTPPFASLPGMADPVSYEIRVLGLLDPSWKEWFEPLRVEIQADAPFTILTGELPDQAALFGTLNKLYTLRMPLISVRLVAK